MDELNENDIYLINKLKEMTNTVTQGSDGEFYNIIEKKTSDYTRHCLITGMLHKDKKQIAIGLSCNSPTGNTSHGESAAISSAYLVDPSPNSWISIVSLVPSSEIKIKSPCGICRELLNYHHPDIYVIVQEPLKKIKAKYLLPFPYVNTEINKNSIWENGIEIRYI